jgi:hypothetical protein
MNIETNASKLKYFIEVINEVSRLIKASEDRVLRIEVNPDNTRIYTYVVITSARETTFLSYKQAVVPTREILGEISSSFVAILSDINNTVRLMEMLEGDVIKGKLDISDRGVLNVLQLKDDNLRIKIIGSDTRLLDSMPESKIKSLLELTPVCEFDISKSTHDRIIKLMRSNTSADTIRINVSKDILKFDDRKWALNICEVKDVDTDWTFKRDYIGQNKPTDEKGVHYIAYHDKILTTCGEYMLIFGTEIEID